MNRRTRRIENKAVVLAMIPLLHGCALAAPSGSGATTAPVVPATSAQEASAPAEQSGLSSTEQGQTPLDEAYEWGTRDWRLEARRQAIEDTQFKFNWRTMYLDREKYDGSDVMSFATGGWAGLKTGYFLDRISLGATVYTSQHLDGNSYEDGALMLEPGQESYTVLGELYADVRIADGMNLYAGRKEFDTPFINKNDTRMTPNAFEAIVLMGTVNLGGGGGETVTSGKTTAGDGKAPVPIVAATPVKGPTLRYGIGYFDSIKERNSVDFVSMSEDAGADVDRGVFTAGALYQNGGFSIGAIDYYSEDIINIAYFEAKQEIALGNGWKPRLALQYTDQRSVGDDLLAGDFEARQWGLKAELPVGNALFTAGYTDASGDSDMRNPWSGYPGYTSVQVEDFYRDGESAFILRAGYEFPQIKGLSAYALWVHGSEPDADGQFARDEYDFNVQWAPPEGTLKGLSLRLRYAHVEQRDGNDDTLDDFRVICNYAKSF